MPVEVFMMSISSVLVTGVIVVTRLKLVIHDVAWNISFLFIIFGIVHEISG